MSTDGARTWTPKGKAGVPVTMVEAAPDGSVYAHYAGVGLFKSDVDTADWGPIYQNLGDQDLLHMATDPDNPNNLAAVSQASKVFESLDGGKTWHEFGK